MKKNTQIDNTIKLKFLSALLLSNISLFLFMDTAPENNMRTCSKRSYLRKDYIKLKIRANLKVPFELNTPVLLTNFKRSFVIKDVYLIKQIQIDSLDIGQTKLDELIVEIKKEDFKYLSHKNHLVIYPYNISLPLSTKRNKHEIIF